MVGKLFGVGGGLCARLGAVLVLLIGIAQTGLAGWQPLATPGLASLGLSAKPGELALASQARVLAVAAEDDLSVILVNPDTGAVTGTIALPKKAISLALDAAATRLYLLQEESGSVFVYDTATGALVSTWNVGGTPVALALRPGSSELIVLDASGKRIVAVNTDSGAVARTQTLTLQPETLAINAAGSRVMIGTHDGKLLTLDGASWNTVSSVSTGNFVRSVSFWESSGLAIVVQKGPDAVSFVNIETGAVTGQVPVDTDPGRSAINASASKAYVTAKDDLSVNQVDLATRRNDGRYLVPTVASALVFDPVARVLYLSQPLDKALVKLDPAQNPLIGTITLTKRLRDIAVNNATHEAAAVAEKADELSRIRLADQALETLALPEKPYRIAIDAARNQASVAFKNAVGFINLATTPATMRSERVALGDDIVGIATDSARSVSLVATLGATPLHVIDNLTRTKIASVSSAEKLTVLGIDSLTGLAYIATESKKLLTFDIPTRTFTATTTLAFKPDAIAVDSQLHLAVLIDSSADKAHVMDLGTRQIARTASIPRHPGAVDIQPETHIAVIASKESDQVSLLNITSGAVTPGYAAVDSPFALATSSRYNQALVLSGEKDNITIVPLPNPAPELLSIVPAQVTAGAAAFTMTVNGRYFVDRSRVVFGTTELVTRWISGSRLEAEVPAGLVAAAGSVNVLVRTPAPGGGDSASLPFVIRALPPSLATITPTMVVADGQPKTFTLNGQNFTTGATVLFGAVSVTPSSITATQITVQALGSFFGGAGSLAVKVVNADAQESGTLTITINAKPDIASVSPASVVIDAQAHVFTLTGTGFQAGAGIVANGSQSLTPTSVTATQVVVSVPASFFVSPGTLTLALSNPDGGTSNTISVSMAAPPAPTITSIAPSTVTAGSAATQLTINGTGYANGAIVKAGNPSPTTLTAVFVSSQQLTVTIPASLLAQAGSLPIVVVNPGAVVESVRTSNPIALTISALEPLPPFNPPPLNPTVAMNLKTATEFLYTGPSPVQTGVAPGTIDGKRLAVIRGKVLSRDGQALSHVTVKVVGHPEFGQTKSRLDGMFDLAVNGGGTLALSYERTGYLTVQRHVLTAWKDFVRASDVVMTTMDTNVTAVDLTRSQVQVARGSVSSDTSGSRQATLLFLPGTTASRLMPDGSTQPLSTVSVRATEYTVGSLGKKAMPAALPPSSAYTYAVELSVDEFLASGAKKLGGKDVLFSQPVPFYLDNFLNFPVGEQIPVGYYDNDRSTWVPYPNGRVIKILSISAGIAALDTNGDGVEDSAAQLAAMGISDAERTTLATLYPIGKSLWRIALSHFSTWDANLPFAPDDGADFPDEPPPDSEDPDKPDCKKGSVIGCQDQTLGERIRIAGTSFSLHYNSNRAPGFAASRSVRIPLSGATVPASLRRIELEVHIAGRVFTQSFSNVANQSYMFQWDGLDAYGRIVSGAQPARVRVGYVYAAKYVGSTSGASFGGFGNPLIPLSPARDEFTFWQENTASLGAWDARASGLGGWTVNIHHAVDQAGVRYGNGQTDATRAVASVVTTVAGNGAIGAFTGSIPATAAPITVYSASVDPAGNYYILNTFGAIFKVVADGTLSPFASIANAVSITTDKDGNLYVAVADPSNTVSTAHRIDKVSPQGVVTTIAGTVQGFSGDGGPAIAAKLNSPMSVAVDGEGNVYVSDWGNLRIRRISTDGNINTIAGTGARGYSGDGGPAINATFSDAFGLDVDSLGNIFVADTNNQRVRRITPSGTINTIAGNGVYPPVPLADDGLQATNARIGFPTFVKVDSRGYVHFGGFSDNTLWRIRSDGIISRVIGNGAGAFSGDGGLAKAAEIFRPHDMALDAVGRIYLADTQNRRLRQISPKQIGYDDADVTTVSEDGRELYHFDSAGRHLRTLNAKTGAVIYSFGYTATGLLAQIIDGDGNVTRIDRTGDVPTAIVSQDGQLTTLGLDTAGYLAEVRNPNGESIKPLHAADGLLSSITNARNYTSLFSYWPDGRLRRDSNPATGYSELTRVNSGGDYEVTLTTAMNRQSRYRVEFTPSGDVRRTNTNPDGTSATVLNQADGTSVATNPDGSVQSLVQGPDPRFGALSPILKSSSIRMPSGLTMTLSAQRSVVLTDPGNPLTLASQADTVTVNGKPTTTTYTASNRTLSVVTPMGRLFSTVMDMQGRRTRSSAAGIVAAEFGYDARGRLATVSRASGTETRSYFVTYNGQGFVDTVTDPMSRTYSYTYDLVGRVKTLTMPGNRVIAWTYDANGNIASVTPPGRPSHTMGYSPVDLEDRYTPPAIAGIPTPATEYGYNSDRQLTTVTRPDGQVVTFSYGTMGKLDSVILPGRTINATYFANSGQAEGLSTSQGQGLSFTYDGPHVTRETFTGLVAGTIERGFNGDFLMSSLSVNGLPIIFDYDDDRLLKKVGNLTIDRDPQNGRVTGTSLGSVATTHGYNGFGEENSFSASFAGTSLYSATSSFDKLGNITQVIESVGAQTDTLEYSYDELSRLSGLKRNGVPVETYTYDDNGNRTSANGSTSTYDDQDRLLSSGSAAFTHTDNGERKSRTIGAATTTYVHDALGNLTQVSLSTGRTIEYVLDGRNRRVAKKVNGALVQAFLYEDQLRPSAELSASGIVISRFIYAGKVNVPDYMIKGGNTYRIITDARGSPRLVVDAQTGVIAQEMQFDAYGRIIVDTNPGFQPFGFAGGLYDSDTALTHFGARDYDPETGRWLSKDPLRFGGGSTNLYAYGSGNPASLVDPTGLRQCDIDAAYRTASDYFGDADWVDAPFVTDFDDPLVAGQWDPETMQMFISDFHLGDLGENYSPLLRQLLGVMIHEFLHAYSWTGGISGSTTAEDHRWIYTIQERLTDQLYRGFQRNRGRICGCKK